MTSRTVAVFCTLLVAACVPRATAAAPLPKEEIDRFVSPLVDAEYCVGVVVGVVDEGGQRLFGYGRKSSTEDTPPDGKTVYEIGSATKAFTGLLLADMVRRGDVAFDDPVQKYLPEGTKVPQVDGTVITLAHLASHTSGLPRMPTNFAPKDPGNPYADYGVERMYAFLAECEPARPAGESVEYSNLGMGLLGHALARRAGKSYEQLVIERICKPLKMNETRMTLTDGMKSRLAPGHDADGNAAANWDIPTFAGAGALRSTGDDMLNFLAANLRPGDAGELAEALRDSQSVRTGADAANDVALGWHVRRKPKFVWHNGQTGGYHSMVAFSPEKKVGVVLLANSATMQVDAHAFALLRRLMGDKVEPPKVRTPVKVDPEVLEAYVGQYPLSPAFILTVTREGERLFCQATGQAKFRIFPASETEFFYRVVEAKITFERGEDGAVQGLVLHQNGAKLPGVKRK
jgi:CubicO group peptidase (beta-lactamase class C family)